MKIMKFCPGCGAGIKFNVVKVPKQKSWQIKKVCKCGARVTLCLDDAAVNLEQTQWQPMSFDDRAAAVEFLRNAEKKGG